MQHSTAQKAETMQAVQAAPGGFVIGAGVRMTTEHVAEFEQVIDTVRHGAPGTPIAFNASPDSSGEAAERWVSVSEVALGVCERGAEVSEVQKYK